MCAAFDASAAFPAGDGAAAEQGTPSPGEGEWFSVHGQSTYVWQQKNNFRTAYHGLNSLTNVADGGGEKSYTWSGTGFLGARLLSGTEAYYNLEMFEGVPFTGALVGLGGFQNGELQKGAYVPPIFYNARAFIRHTIGLGGGKTHLEGDINQLAGDVDRNRVVLTYGRIASLDYFDQNQYSHDPRTQFQNFSIWSLGAYGYAADSKGYTYGLVGEWYQDNMVFRAARLAVTTLPGGTKLDWSLRRNYVDTLEVTYNHLAWERPGALRALIYRQYANMAKFDDGMGAAGAINAGLGPTDPRYEAFPINAVRNLARSWGYGVNAEQAISADVGVFARWSWNPGTTETLTLEMNQSIAGGLVVKGRCWGRAGDVLGLGFASNGISGAEAEYLGRGYNTVFLGDGALQYRKERVVEAYYSLEIRKGRYLSGNFQNITHPGFNAARGPVNFFGFRIHGEF